MAMASSEAHRIAFPQSRPANYRESNHHVSIEPASKRPYKVVSKEQIPEDSMVPPLASSFFY